ncbi:MAG: polyprenyl diphosphate synthase [Aestuariibacter sp.]
MSLNLIPKHVAIIMDGNGRWAKQQGKLRTFGHRAGVKSVRASVEFCRENNISALTLFAFSSENWLRPKDEVGALMELFALVLGSEVKKLHRNGVQLRVIGDLSRFEDKLVSKIRKAEALTADNKDLVLNIAANYGGKWDIVNAARQIAERVLDKQMNIEDISEDALAKFISMSNLPDVDLLIRTGGEYRISNFVLWQAAYAELYFTPTLWPDFNKKAFQAAIDDFACRQRRFGMTGDQVAEQVG